MKYIGKIMMYIYTSKVCIFILLLMSLESYSKDLKLWYKTPADVNVVDRPYIWDDDVEWLKALPLGNGSLGAMVFGGVQKERIQINEESLWSGGYQEADNFGAFIYLKQIKDLLFQGKYREATDLANKTQVCVGEGSGKGNGAEAQYGCYQTLGDVWIDFVNKSSYTEYVRELNLNDATVSVFYKQNGVNYRRDLFVSYPDKVLVVKLSADKKEQISFTCGMNRPQNYKTYSSNKQLIMEGTLPNGKGGRGMKYITRLKAVVKNGDVVYGDSTLSVNKADEVILLLSASTNYQQVYPTYKKLDYKKECEDNIYKSSLKTFAQLYERHKNDYSNLFDRVKFELDDSQEVSPTDQLVQMARNGEVASSLYELLFQYGRYLLISSSRPGTLPANLQGIWANKIQTAWNGDYHTDINVEMNYWPAEVTNLSECHLPLFDLLESLVEPGRKTAKNQYNMNGWVVHPITNIWGYTSPGESSSWGMHTGATAWLCQHIGEHFRFTGDKTFLERMYPVLQGAVEFYMDWLSYDGRLCKYVSGPAVSPENSFIAPDGSVNYISMGPTHDQQTIWQLFNDFVLMSGILNVNTDFVRAVNGVKEQLLTTCIGQDGRIMEWAREYPETTPGHRHFSHLFAFFPGAQFNLLTTPTIVNAAKKSIDYRVKHLEGDIGWSAAWRVCLYARMLQGNLAKDNLDRLLERSLASNLFTLCPPFQIDANFGTTAGIAEMLLQSHVITDTGEYVLQLLPGLPKEWKNGHYSGLKARGGFEIDVVWKDGKLAEFKIKSLLGNKYRIWYNGKYINTNLITKDDIVRWKKS